MARMKFFHGEMELVRPNSLPNKEFAELFPGVKGKSYDGYHKWIGENPAIAPVWNKVAAKWEHAYLPVERIIQFKSNPSLHQCNAKCLNAKGFQCECSCGGKNHGNGGFRCE